MLVVDGGGSIRGGVGGSISISGSGGNRSVGLLSGGPLRGADSSIGIASASVSGGGGGATGFDKSASSSARRRSTLDFTNNTNNNISTTFYHHCCSV